MRAFATTLLAAACAWPAVASAQDASGCTKFKWSIERERTAFAAPDLATVPTGQSLPPGGKAVALKLAPQDGVAFEKPPGKAAKVNPAFAAVLPMPTVASAGTYQVTLSDEAWIDVVQNGREVRSTAFSGQPNCPGVRKSVRFPLQAGPATIQISGAATDSLKLDVLPAE